MAGRMTSSEKQQLLALRNLRARPGWTSVFARSAYARMRNFSPPIATGCFKDLKAGYMVASLSLRCWRRCGSCAGGLHSGCRPRALLTRVCDRVDQRGYETVTTLKSLGFSLREFGLTWSFVCASRQGRAGISPYNVSARARYGCRGDDGGQKCVWIIRCDAYLTDARSAGCLSSGACLPLPT